MSTVSGKNKLEEVYRSTLIKISKVNFAENFMHIEYFCKVSAYTMFFIG